MRLDQARELSLRDRQAEDYERMFLSLRGEYWVRAQLAETIRALRLRGARTLYDAGSGVGIYALEIARRHPGLGILAVDFSPRSVEVLRNRAMRLGVRGLRTEVADLTAYTPPEGAFDRVLCSEVLQHVPGEVGRRAAVRNLFAALRPGGRAVATAYRWGGLVRPPAPKEELDLRGTGLCRYAFTGQEFADLFADAGFVEVRTRAIIRTPPRVQRRLPASLAAGVERCLMSLHVNARNARYLLVEAVRPPAPLDVTAR
jgi:SAM-dependent methyltransferase